MFQMPISIVKYEIELSVIIIIIRVICISNRDIWICSKIQISLIVFYIETSVLNVLNCSDIDICILESDICILIIKFSIYSKIQTVSIIINIYI